MVTHYAISDLQIICQTYNILFVNKKYLLRSLYSRICFLKDMGGKSPIPKGISGFLWFFINIW